MNSPDVALSLAYCPMEVESFTSCSEKIDPRSAASETMNVSTRAAASTEDKQDDSAMTEELTSRVVLPGNRNYVEEQPVPVADWPSIGSKDNEGLERMGSGTSTVSGSAGSGGPCEDSRRLSMPTELGKLPSSQYKGVVPQPNGRWGAQIYEKHQRVWLGTFNREEDAAKAYDRAALKFRGRDAMTNFRPAGDGDPEARFLSDHTKGEIIDMLRKHTYEEELDHHDKKSVAVEVSGAHGSLERSVHGDHPENDVNDTVSLPREHLFDKAVTPSDVGKLNRLVIPKQHAEKYFPLDINANEKGLLLNFEDNAGKVWRFRYSYWNSSQSYVLTKGWSRFVKDNKLQAGDIVSFQRSTAQLYICWRRRPAASYPSQSIKGVYPHFHSPAAGTSPAMVTFNPQWMHIFSMDAFNYSANHAVNDRAGAHELWSQPAPATASMEFPRPQLNDTILPFTFFTANQPPPDRCFSRLPRSLKPATQDGPGDAARFPLIQPCMDLYLPVNNNSVCWNDQNINISTLPFTKLTDPSAELAQQFGDCRNRAFAPLENKAGSSFDPATSKKGVRLFGVNLDDRRPHSNRSPSTPRAQSASACSPCKDDQDEFCSLRKRQFSDPHHHIISAMEEITGSKKSCI